MNIITNSTIFYNVKNCEGCPFWTGFSFINDGSNKDYCTIAPDSNGEVCMLNNKRIVVRKVKRKTVRKKK